MTMDATRQRLLMCRPTYFAVDYAINPWMDPDRAGRRRRWRSGSGRRSASAYLDLGHRVELIDPVDGLPDMVFAANGGTVVDGRDGGAVPPPAARRRGPRLPDWFVDSRLRDVVPKHRQRGRGRLPARRRPPAGRHRVPHRRTRARRGPGVPRPAGGHATAGGPALLPPGHRALPCSTSGTWHTCRRLSPPGARRCCAASSPTPSCDRGRRRGARPQRGQRRHGNVVIPPRPPISPPSCATGASRPSRSTCPSCARPAADRSAARWRSGDSSGRTAGKWIINDSTADAIRVRDAERRSAHNYHPLPVVISSAEGAWVDRRGRQALPGLPGRLLGAELRARHPKLIAAAHAQLTGSP